jgi:hypothetical protein
VLLLFLLFRRKENRKSKAAADNNRRISDADTSGSYVSSGGFEKGNVGNTTPELPAAIPTEVHGESANRMELPGSEEEKPFRPESQREHAGKVELAADSLDEKAVRPELPSYSSNDKEMGSKMKMNEKPTLQTQNIQPQSTQPPESVSSMARSPDTATVSPVSPTHRRKSSDTPVSPVLGRKKHF